MILGLNAFHGDSSAAFFRGGHLVAAVEEERLNRIKHWAGLPLEAARYCLNGEVPEHVAVSRDPRANLYGKAFYAIRRPEIWRRVAGRAGNSLQVSRVGESVRKAGIGTGKTSFHFVEHHRAHLASAFFCSPFEEAAVVSIDGFGDFSSVMWGTGRGNQIMVADSVHFPHSLGQFYTAFTQFLGFPKYGDEYKMMGMSAYGEPRFASQVRDVVATQNGKCRLNLKYFTHHSKGVL
jgi:carbamoyltransferase